MNEGRIAYGKATGRERGGIASCRFRCIWKAFLVDIAFSSLRSALSCIA